MKDTVDSYPRAPWGEYPLPGEEPALWQFGPLTLWCKSLGNEVWIAKTGSKINATNESTDDPTLPEDKAWSRWALERPYPYIQMLPVFPDRPVVVKPEVPFHLIRNGGNATIYIRVPLWVRMSVVKDGSRITLLEAPIVTLSDTWFGSYISGERCYWISSGARRDLETDASRPHLAACTIHIRNDSNDDLHVDKICLVVAHLSLFDRKGQLFSDEATIDFKGAQEVGGFSVSGTSPFSEALLISSPRTPTKPDFSARTLLSFMS